MKYKERLMDDTKYEKEIEKKERFTQTFLLIGSFLLATYSGDVGLISRFFAGTLVSGLIYYVFLTNIKIPIFISGAGIIFSIVYSIYIITFSDLMGKIGYSNFGYACIVILFASFFSYALLSPFTTDNFNRFISNFSNSHVLISRIMGMIFLAIYGYVLITEFII